MKIVIMAGGKGTRIASINSEVPKPMIQVLGKPILEYQIETLKEQRYTDIILVVGHLGDVIKEYFGDGSKFGVEISYITEQEPLGTAGALYYLKNDIHEDFLLVNGDIIFDVDIHKFEQAHKNNDGYVTILTHPNDHPYDSGVIFTNEAGMVTQWLTKEDDRRWYQNRVNAGLHMISPIVLKEFLEPQKVDLDRDILKKLIDKGQLYAYDSPEYVKDMGTPDRYYAVTEDIISGKVQKRNLKNRQRAIFLDRDGTINIYKGFIRDIEDFELIEGAAAAIKKMNQAGYLVIVVTNQPVIARGEISEEELREIHNKMETLLGNEGAYIDDLYYCPHHPDKGFEGERPEYKIECDCRKPKPGLILKAAEKYNIDLAQSWMVGDSVSDIEAGKAAGCKTAFLDRKGIESDSYLDLRDFVEHVI